MAAHVDSRAPGITGRGPLAAPAFIDGGRFEVEGILGQGGMGSVYRAFDRLRRSPVALKALLTSDPGALLLFKQEFRSVADVSHPNLVTLYELFSEEEWLYFTMELIHGVRFRAHVRGDLDGHGEASEDRGETQPVRSGPAAADDDVSTRPMRAAEPLIAPPERPVVPLTAAGIDRLRPALRQLATGVCALHDAGKLHRDIKSSNILVTAEGRVVLLDFGLVTEAGGRLEAPGAGTAAYMSPEQAAGHALTAASDWYSVGVVLYEALTGRYPFSGSIAEVVHAKQTTDPPRPRELAPALPADLDDLCMDLLDRNGAARPGGAAVLRRLVDRRRRASVAPARQRAAAGAVLVGRDPQLEVLADAFDEARQRAVTVYIHGAPGSGKSALVRTFADELSGSDSAFVLSGRCHQSESVPFKTMDGVIDSLSRVLTELPDDQLRPLLPADLPALVRLFPVLRRVEARIGGAAAVAAPDPQELRRRAFAALRELCTALAGVRGLAIIIDDLHWGDADGVALLAELMRPPDAPPLLLVATYRSEERERSGALQALLHGGWLAPGRPGVRQLSLGPLAAADARRMAELLLGDDADERVGGIVRESGGNPFFITELVHAGAPAEGPVSLDALLRARCAGLPPPARRLLEVVAVAGHPLDTAIASRVATPGESYLQAVAQLRAGHLVRVDVRDRETIEPYHDRIRESMLALLDDDTLRYYHRALAVELESARTTDPETLGEHFLQAGDVDRARAYLVASAARASDALAFDRAAALYRQALTPDVPDDPERHRLRVLLADALAAAGRGGEAAAEYLRAATRVSDVEALEMTRRAAEQQLISGHLVDGLATVGQVLDRLGMGLPAGPKASLASLLSRRAGLRLRTLVRGYHFRERDAGELTPLELVRIDACWTIAVGLAMNDHIHGADFSTRSLRLALRAGEPNRALRSLAAEIAYMATQGGGARRRCAELGRLTAELAERRGDPYARGMAVGASGMAAYLLGEREQARAQCAQAESVFTDNCRGVAWEVNTVRIFHLWSLFYLGKFGELTRRVPRLLADALARGDLYAAYDLRIGLPSAAWLALDDPAEALRQIDEATAERPRTSFHLQDYTEVLGRAHIDLYCGDPAAAWERVEAVWPPLARSLLLRIQNVRIEAHWLRGRCALATAGRDPALLRRVQRDVRRLAGERVGWAIALSGLLRAGLAARRGQLDDARAALERAEQGFSACQMEVLAEVARRRAAELAGDAAAVDAADAALRQRRIRDPVRMAAMLAPGFDGAAL